MSKQSKTIEFLKAEHARLVKEENDCYEEIDRLNEELAIYKNLMRQKDEVIKRRCEATTKVKELVAMLGEQGILPHEIQ